MTVRHRKLVLRSDPSVVDLSLLLPPIRSILRDLLHFAISYSSEENKVCFYLQTSGYISENSKKRLARLFEDQVGTVTQSPYSKVEGELKEEWRLRRKRTQQYKESRSDTSIILVNPVGEESLQGITREFVSGLLQQTLNTLVFFEFGKKLYSLEQNMNFRASRHPNVHVRTKASGWIWVPKAKAYDNLLRALVDKTQEAVELYKDSISAFDLNHFNTYVSVVFENKDSDVPLLKKVYEDDRDGGLDAIAVVVTERIKQLREWLGKRIRLV